MGISTKTCCMQSEQQGGHTSDVWKPYWRPGGAVARRVAIHASHHDHTRRERFVEVAHDSFSVKETIKTAGTVKLAPSNVTSPLGRRLRLPAEAPTVHEEGFRSRGRRRG
jgi:hypothetical protein